MASHTWNNIEGPASSVIVGPQQESSSDQVAFLPMWTGVPQKQSGTHPHSGWSHRSCLDIRQLINTVEFLSIYSKDYSYQYTHTCFKTEKRQSPHHAYDIKGLIHLEVCACFSVHSGIQKKYTRPCSYSTDHVTVTRTGMGNWQNNNPFPVSLLSMS